MATETDPHDCGIYKIQSPSGNYYVGSSKHIPTRWRQHRWELRTNKHTNSALQNAYDKYGPDGLKFEKILVCEEKDLLFYEQLILDNLHPEYNIVQIAGSGPNRKGIPHSEEHKKKLSEALIGNTRWSGKKHTPETIEKMRLSATGRKHSPETREKLSAAQYRRYSN